MGEMADMALSNMLDMDEIQQTYQTMEDAEDMGYAEALYDYDGSRFPEVFSRLPYSLNRLAKNIIRSNEVVKVSVQNSKAKLKKTSSAFLQGIQDISMPEGGLKFLIYGRSGTGKTSLACTFAKPLLLIRAEEGTRSVHNVAGVKTTPRLTHPDELGEVLEMLRAKHEFQTVVLDTAGSYQDVILREVIGRDIPVQMVFGEVTRDQWGQCALQMKERMKAFYDLADLGYDLVLLAHEREDDTEQTSDLLLPTVGAGVMPSVKAFINKEADYICQTCIREQAVEKRVKLKSGKTIKKTVDEIQFLLRTAPHAVYDTKFRLPRGTPVPKFIIDPNYDKIINLIAGKASLED